MSEQQDHKKQGKFLSLVLRHKPEVIGIELDINGWADVPSLLSNLTQDGKPMDFETLSLIVSSDDKGRFEFNSDMTKIRASQGHSISVQLGYKPTVPPDVLYHGTAHKYVDSINRLGLERQNRHHVHLSLDQETAYKVGQRHGKPVIFEVLAKDMYQDGHEFFVSNNGVWLTERVPVRYLAMIT